MLKNIDCWPALPIVVEYGGSPALDPPASEDEDSILAALKCSDRVISIYLTVTKSLLEKLYSIEEPFSNLEDLVLRYQDGMELVPPSAFRWGTHLRKLQIAGIGFSTPLYRLSSSRGLVDLQLQLHNTVSTAYLSPEALASALAGMAQLRLLSLYHCSSTSHPEPVSVLPSSADGKRVAFPSLTYFKFRGTSTFLDRFVVSIDPPLLGTIEITFDQPTFLVPKLGEFISQIELQKSHHRADVLFSDRSISISLTQRASTCLKLQVISESLRLRLSSVAQICSHFSAFLHGVEDLRINAMQPLSEQDDENHEGWLELFHAFKGTKWVHVANDYSTNIMLALRHSEMQRETVLPALHKLYIREPGPRYAALKKAACSFMYLRRLSGHTIGVEYERPSINELRVSGTTLFNTSFSHASINVIGVGPFSRQQGTIEMLSVDVLLEVFRHYLYDTQNSWPTLIHVCKSWRQIVLSSPVGLALRLYCTHGTPVLKTLQYWPPIPLILNYGGSSMLDPPAPEDDDNIVAALQQSDRVRSIKLTVTGSLLEKLSAISEPFSELEELVLLSTDNVYLHNDFRWGPHLLTLHSTRIAIPSFPRLLSPCHGLVDIQLHEITIAGYFSPESFSNALSGMTQLRSLSLHFLSLPPRRNYLRLLPPPEDRVVLPALRCLKYRGTSKYLDSLVAGIDAPFLKDIDITFFSQPTIDASQLSQFINRTEMQMSLTKADIQTSAHTISIYLSEPGAPTQLKLKISCRQLDQQLSSMAQICYHFSPCLSSINDLGIISTQSLSMDDAALEGDTGHEEWLLLFPSFVGVTDFRVAGVHATDILGALYSADTRHIPSLHNIRLQVPMPLVGLVHAAQSFIAMRLLSGFHIELHFSCHFCDTSSTQQQELRTHLVDKHMLRKVCPFCGVFRWPQGRSYLFEAHLASKHPEAVHIDLLIWNPHSERFPIFPS